MATRRHAVGQSPERGNRDHPRARFAGAIRPAWACRRPWSVPGGAALLAADFTADEIQAMLANVASGDLSSQARTQRMNLRTALACVRVNGTIRKLEGAGGWVDAVFERRTAYLRALDAGKPPPARAVIGMQRAVPRCLGLLGKTLPTAEAVGLLSRVGPVLELGAGFGLFARALERAGVPVVATDPGTSGEAGIGFPVHAGDAGAVLDAVAKLAKRPTILISWPRFDDGLWFEAAFAEAVPGQMVAMASPEYEFAMTGGWAAGLVKLAARHLVTDSAWHRIGDLMARIASDFEEVGQAPLAGADLPLQPTPLRLWRRR